MYEGEEITPAKEASLSYKAVKKKKKDNHI